MIKLYHDPISTTSRPVMLFVAEHDLPVEMIRVPLLEGAHLTDEYAAINPNRAVPALVDGELAIGECSAILKYLAERAGSPTYPAGLEARTRVNSAMDWLNTGFYRDFGYGFVYPQVFAHCAYADPAAQSEVVKRGLDNARRWLAVLDEHMLDHGGPYLLGSDVSIADYLGASYLAIGDSVGFGFGEWPRVDAWLAAMRARPSWTPTFAAFEAFLAAIGVDRLAADAEVVEQADPARKLVA